MKKEALIAELCEYFNCSDLNDYQYPKCDLWDTNKCEGSKVFNRIEPLLIAKEENQNSAPLAELLIWCEEKMNDCRATADPDDALSCELAECGFHDFMYMREKVASMIRAACPAEKLTQVKSSALREIAATMGKILCGYAGECEHVTISKRMLKQWRQLLLT